MSIVNSSVIADWRGKARMDMRREIQDWSEIFVLLDQVGGEKGVI
jgi:hypothetical protein